jgi:PBP1b-binding outer membrane lipoprotein LpoB
MKKISLLGIILSSLILLSGCMYPDSAKTENLQAYEDQLLSVQKAVEQYPEASGGLLPIKTRERCRPIY